MDQQRVEHHNKPSLVSSLLNLPFYGKNEQWSLKDIVLWRMTMIACLLCFLWNVSVFSPEPFGVLSSACGCNGVSICVCTRPTVYALNLQELLLLLIARLSSYSEYPLIVMIFFTKCNNLRTALNKTFLGELLPFFDLHKFHRIFGTWLFYASTLHSIAHLIRWGIRAELVARCALVTGWSGIIAQCLLFAIVLPMSWARLKEKLSYEFRKSMHYLSVPWALFLLFHAPATGTIASVLGVSLALYVTDWLYGFFVRTYHIKSSKFSRLDNAVQFSFRKPDGFDLSSVGYVYICLPWISTLEWHPFSIYPSLKDHDHYCICMAVTGDWTAKLHAELACPSSRPAWIYGPFPSPFNHAQSTDDVLCVASGIGITPAICVLHEYADTRRVNLVWICREASMIEFFLENVKFDDDAFTLIYYTGKERPLSLPPTLPEKVLLFEGRPDMEAIVLKLVEAGAREKRKLQMVVGSQKSKSIILEQLEGRGENPMDLLRKTAINVAAVNKLRPRIEIRKMMETYTPEELFRYALLQNSDSALTDKGLLSLQGLETAVLVLCSQCISTSIIQQLFDEVDTDRSGYVDRYEFMNLVSFLKNYAADTIPAAASNASATSNSTDFSLSDIYNEDDEELLGALRQSSHHWKVAYSASSNSNSESQHDISIAQPAPSNLVCTHSKMPIDNAENDMELSFENLKPTIEIDYTSYPILYCGGNAIVVETLRGIGDKFGIPVFVEKFDW